MTGTLPKGFEDLDHYVETWGRLTTAEERFALRQQSAQPDLIKFHEAVAPRLGAIFDHLDQFAVGAMPQLEQCLFNLTLGVIEASQAVEVFGQPLPPGAREPRKIDVEIMAFPSA